MYKAINKYMATPCNFIYFRDKKSPTVLIYVSRLFHIGREPSSWELCNHVTVTSSILCYPDNSFQHVTAADYENN